VKENTRSLLICVAIRKAKHFKGLAIITHISPPSSLTLPAVSSLSFLMNLYLIVVE